MLETFCRDMKNTLEKFKKNLSLKVLHIFFLSLKVLHIFLFYFI